MEVLYWGSSSLDLKIIIFFLLISLAASLIVLVFAKRKFLAPLVFSIASNLIFLAAVFSPTEMFRAYGLIWLEIFSLLIWPFINAYLIYFYYKPKK